MQKIYSKSEIIEIAHKNINEILTNNREPLLLNKLVDKLNNRLKDNFPIKKKCFTKYLKNHCGGILNFLDEYINYGVIFKGNKIEITLLDEDYNLEKRITLDSEWIFI